jgi:hypothetical protein
MTHHAENRAVILLLSLICSLFCNLAEAQTADKLFIDGPEFENCLVTIRYFKARQIDKAISLKICLLKGGVEEPIEGGFDGVEVFLQAQASPIQMKLFAGSEEAASETLEEAGTSRLTTGKVGRVEFTPEKIELSNDESRLLESYVAAYNAKSSTEAIVSTAEDSAVDYPCLDVFNRELQLRIGSVDLSKSIQGFVSWRVGEKSRMIAGVLHGDAGSCGIRLVHSDGKLVDVQPNCPKLVDDYFREPLETGPYIKKAEQIIRLLFEGKSEQAQKLYARQFQQQVTVEQVGKLVESLRSRYGEKISSLSVKRTQLMDYNFAQKSRFLHVDLLIEMEKGSRNIGRVTFSIPSSRGQVGSGLLAGVNVNPVLSSAYPQHSKNAQILLDELNKNLKAAHIAGILHPELKAIFDSEAAQQALDRLNAQMKGQPMIVDFDLWTVTQGQDLIQAAGTLKYGEKDCYAEVQFTGEKSLLGFSFYGPAVAESTMGMFKFPPTIGETAKQFWTHLLNSNADAAHGMLHKDFQAQFSIEELKQQLAEPEARPAKLKSVSVDSVRLASQPIRPLPLMATVYLTAEFQDGDTQYVACDIELPQGDAQPTIHDFTNEFETDFPIVSIPVANSKSDGAELALQAFQSKDAQKLLELIEPSRREVIDQATLKAYFENFRKIAGDLSAPLSTARTVEYARTGKRYRCNLFFKSASGEELPIEAWFNNGYLERFIVSHPKVNDFVLTLSDKSGVKRRVEAFVESWFRDVAESRPYMISALHSAGTTGALNAMKTDFERKHGKLKKISVGQDSPGEGAGEVEFIVALEGESGSQNARVLVDIGAFGGLVSAVSIE